MVEAYRLVEAATGSRVLLPGFFAAAVVIEHAEVLGDDVVYLRVRTPAGALEELPVPSTVLERALAGPESNRAPTVSADDLALLVESARIRLAFAYDPYFAVSLSGIQALPHQLEAVYERMLPQPRLRFLLAHDPGAGKTIMAGLLLKELKLRNAIDRILIVCPAPLTIQWQDELRSKFDETFEIVGPELARNSLAGNAWDRFPQVITSLDFAKQPHVAADVLRARWDLVVIDEAHKCSAQRFGTEVKKTLRYEFAEALSRETDRLLLMTATPHQGSTEQFGEFLKLLDADQFVGLKIDRDLISLEDSPWFSRRIKEDLRDFDGRRLFTDRHAITQGFELRPTEFELYTAITDYINQFLPRQTGRRRSSVALARSVFQRRLASSLGAIEATLSARKLRLAGIVEELDRLPESVRDRRMQELRLLPIDEEMESDDSDAEDEERIAVGAVAVDRLAEIRLEVGRLTELIAQTQRTREAGEEAKLLKLRECLDLAELGELRDGRGKLLIFTEYRATQDYLVEHLERWGYTTCVIHGGMDAQRRKAAQAEFQTEKQICVATEAAGEGINLQFCHLMINYDIPWNPNRLEQRMGRIHRIGQRFDVTVLNFVAENTVEGRILVRLLHKLDEIRRVLGDRVFDVVGTLLRLNNVNLEEMLRDAAYNPTSIDAYEDQIERISPDRLREYEEATGIALATRHVGLDRIRPNDWRSEERRLMPEYVERFFGLAAERVRLRTETRADSLLRVEHVPQRLRAPSLTSVQRFGPPATAYKKLTFRKEHLAQDRHLDAELLSPGHPLFAATVEVLDDGLTAARQATAGFTDPLSAAAYRLYFFELRIMGELPAGGGRPTRTAPTYEELVVVREDADGTFSLAPSDVLHDLTPATPPESGAAPDDVRRAERWLQVSLATSVTERLRSERARENGIRREFLERSFHELIRQRRTSWSMFAARVAGGDETFRLVRDEALRQVEETERRRATKLGELAHLEVLRPGSPVFIACAAVEPSTDQAISVGLRPDPEVELAAVRAAMEHERNAGWEPTYVGDDRDGSGFDIRSVGPLADDGTRVVRRIEVKGQTRGDSDVVLTPNEWTQAARHGSSYWLYVLRAIGSDTPRLLRVQDPAQRLGRSVEKLTVVKGWLVPGPAIEKNAEGPA